jgi:DNA phosphorothioation-dependent restriction protein DptG
MENEAISLLDSLKENNELFENYTNSADLSDSKKEELREMNKNVIEGYKNHVDILVGKLNEVKEKVKELEKEDCAITSVNKVQDTLDELTSFLQKK